jgi:hypothetical protein
VVATILAAYGRQLGHEISLLLRRRKGKYLAGSAGAIVRIPALAVQSARLYLRGRRLETASTESGRS